SCLCLLLLHSTAPPQHPPLSLHDALPIFGLASYAAAGIAKSEPMLTGLTAFSYSARTAILPFMFIFNTQLLLIGIGNTFQLILRSEEHTSELQSRENLVCRLLLEKKKK